MNAPQPTNLNNYDKMNGSFDSIEKTPSAFTSLDTTSYDFYETQSQNQTGVSTAVNSEFEDFSRHPMGRPRPRPSNAENGNGIHGLPVVPPQAPPGHYHHRAMVHQTQQHGQPPNDVLSKPSFDLTFENHNFRETPSMTSMQPSDYWDSSSRLQSNGNAVKYRNTKGPPSPTQMEGNLPRSISMATTMLLAQQSSTDNFPDLDNSDPNNMNNNNSNMLNDPPSRQDGSLHQIGLPLHNFSRSPQHYPPSHIPSSSAGQYPPVTASQSFDRLEFDALGKYDQYKGPDDTYRPNIVGSLGRPQHPPQSEEGEAPGPDSSPATTASLNDSSSPRAAKRRGREGVTQPHSYHESARFPDSPNLDPSDENNKSGSRKARIIETSLDDLEVDYELDETNVRPVSTYLETSVDDALMPPMRSAKSQFLPTASGGGGGSGSGRGAGPAARRINQQRMAHDAEFKALGSRSKSMPLETEM